jgi:hypothetical protein
MVIVLVVMWLVVLVPMFVRRHEDTSEARSRERLATAVRVLARRRPPQSHRVGASRPEYEYASRSRPMSPPRSATVAQVRAGARRRMLARRRRTLTTLTLVAVAGAGAAIVLTAWLWPVAALGALLCASYLVWLRQQVRRQHQRWQRRAAVFSRTTPSYPPHAARPIHTPRTVRRAPAARPGGTRTEPAAQTPAAEHAADGSWQPIPVPVPTYVTKPAYHPARSDSIVGLDDDDPSFAEIDDVVPPLERRRAVNG